VGFRVRIWQVRPNVILAILAFFGNVSVEQQASSAVSISSTERSIIAARRYYYFDRRRVLSEVEIRRRIDKLIAREPSIQTQIDQIISNSDEPDLHKRRDSAVHRLYLKDKLFAAKVDAELDR
jgi:hypothetical protein